MHVICFVDDSRNVTDEMATKGIAGSELGRSVIAVDIPEERVDTSKGRSSIRMKALGIPPVRVDGVTQ